MRGEGSRWGRLLATVALLTAGVPGLARAEEKSAEETSTEEKSAEETSAEETSAEETSADATEATSARRSLIIVEGAAGEAEYARQFAAWASRWEAAGRDAGMVVTRIGPATAGAAAQATGEDDLTRLKDAVARLAGRSPAEVWIVLLGHGTFDGRTARFNLAGPDLEAAGLAESLRPLACPVVVINCASASGPFVNAVSGPGRVVITATQSGAEVNATRLGEHLSAVVRDGGVDLDKDGQASLLELVLAASARTQAGYADEGRLASEHALIDDNADGRGTRADAYEGVRIDASKVTGGRPDGDLARDIVFRPSPGQPSLTDAQRHERRRLEADLNRLRQQRPDPPTEAYFQQLEAILLPLARIYEAADVDAQPPPDAGQ